MWLIIIVLLILLLSGYGFGTRMRAGGPTDLVGILVLVLIVVLLVSLITGGGLQTGTVG